MQFVIKRDILLKSLNFVQGIVEKKNTLPILSNVLLQLKDKKLSIVATDLDIIFYDEISNVKVINEGSTTTSAAILYDILRKIPSNSELNFDLKSENKLLDFERFSKTVLGIILRLTLIWSNTIKKPIKNTIKKASTLFLRNLEACSLQAAFTFFEGSSSSHNLSEPLWRDKYAFPAVNSKNIAPRIPAPKP